MRDETVMRRLMRGPEHHIGATSDGWTRAMHRGDAAHLYKVATHVGHLNNPVGHITIPERQGNGMPQATRIDMTCELREA